MLLQLQIRIPPSLFLLLFLEFGLRCVTYKSIPVLFIMFFPPSSCFNVRISGYLHCQQKALRARNRAAIHKQFQSYFEVFFIRGSGTKHIFTFLQKKYKTTRPFSFLINVSLSEQSPRTAEVEK